MFKDLEEARSFFENDRFAIENGMTIDEIGEGYAVCSVKICSRHRNALGNVMGGVYFTLADFAFAVAVNGIHEPSVAMDSNIAFLTAAKGGSLTARAEVVRSGNTTTYCEVRVKDGEDRLVAVFSGSAYKLR